MHTFSAAPGQCWCGVQGAKNIVKLDISTAMWASAVAGAGAAVLGAVIGVPLLFRQLKVWEETM